MDQPFGTSTTSSMDGNPTTLAFNMVVGFRRQSRKEDSPPVAFAPQPETVFKWTTFPSELAMSNELRGLAKWLLKSTYFGDVQNSVLHTGSHGGIGKSSIYTLHSGTSVHQSP